MKDKLIDKILFILILVFIGLLIQLLTLYRDFKPYVDIWIQVVAFVASILAIIDYIKRSNRKD
ncbi:MAG: hypothetical protein H7A25_16710 [Leptospiraceae bacterium]|nr:hypothetical protein [Leptospiraceae bacterium]